MREELLRDPNVVGGGPGISCAVVRATALSVSKAARAASSTRSSAAASDRTTPALGRRPRARCTRCSVGCGKKEDVLPSGGRGPGTSAGPGASMLSASTSVKRCAARFGSMRICRANASRIVAFTRRCCVSIARLEHLLAAHSSCGKMLLAVAPVRLRLRVPHDALRAAASAASRSFSPFPPPPCPPTTCAPGARAAPPAAPTGKSTAPRARGTICSSDAAARACASGWQRHPPLARARPRGGRAAPSAALPRNFSGHRGSATMSAIRRWSSSAARPRQPLLPSLTGPVPS